MCVKLRQMLSYLSLSNHVPSLCDNFDSDYHFRQSSIRFKENNMLTITHFKLLWSLGVFRDTCLGACCGKRLFKVEQTSDERLTLSDSPVETHSLVVFDAVVGAKDDAYHVYGLYLADWGCWGDGGRLSFTINFGSCDHQRILTHIPFRFISGRGFSFKRSKIPDIDIVTMSLWQACIW